MSIRVAIGSKIYDISNFSEEEHADVMELSKSLNYRVNQVISVFGIYDQEMALIMAALSLLEEVKTIETKSKQDRQELDLFTYQEKTDQGKKEERLFTATEVDSIMEETILSLHKKLKKTMEKVS